MAAKVVVPDGCLVDTGEQLGPDLRGVFIGSEGALGIACEITVRLLRVPQAVRTLLADFPSIHAAGEMVSGLIAAGTCPPRSR